MPTTTDNFITPARTPVHQPAPFEKWLAAQPAAYVGKHRGQAAVEAAPRTGLNTTAPAVP